jgi:hypothetical protein
MILWLLIRGVDEAKWKQCATVGIVRRFRRLHRQRINHKDTKGTKNNQNILCGLSVFVS